VKIALHCLQTFPTSQDIVPAVKAAGPEPWFEQYTFFVPTDDAFQGATNDTVFALERVAMDLVRNTVLDLICSSLHKCAMLEERCVHVWTPLQCAYVSRLSHMMYPKLLRAPLPLERLARDVVSFECVFHACAASCSYWCHIALFYCSVS
jgi:hypothetical protein